MELKAPWVLGEPRQEGVARLSARFSQEDSAAWAKMLAPEPLKIRPLRRLIQDVSSED